MVLSKEGANLPVFTADNPEELQDKWKKTGEALGSEVSSLAPAYSIKEKLFFLLPKYTFSLLNCMPQYTLQEAKATHCTLKAGVCLRC